MTKLEERLSELIDFSGCVSGDCPHEKWADCAEQYKKSIKEFILELPELKALVECAEFYNCSGRDKYGQLFNKVPSAQDKNILVYGQVSIGSEARTALTQWRSFICEGGNEANS